MHAGPTQEINEEIERTIYVDRYLLKTKDCFAMRVKGISMTGAGIEEGDIVVVKRQRTADPGEIVIAMIDGETTLKRFMPQKNGVMLKAENPKSKSYFVADDPDSQCVNGIVGRVIKVIHDMK